jgi:hypothetical protein
MCTACTPIPRMLTFTSRWNECMHDDEHDADGTRGLLMGPNGAPWVSAFGVMYVCMYGRVEEQCGQCRTALLFSFLFISRHFV